MGSEESLAHEDATSPLQSQVGPASIEPLVGPAQDGLDEVEAFTKQDPASVAILPDVRINGMALPLSGSDLPVRVAAAPASNRLGSFGGQGSSRTQTNSTAPPVETMHAWWEADPEVVQSTTDPWQAEAPLLQASPDPSEPSPVAESAGPTITPSALAPHAAPARSIPLTTVALLVSGGLSLVALARWVLAPGVALFSRKASRSEVHPTRETLVQLVEAQPGILLAQLRQKLGCSAGTIQYHVNTLERDGLVKCLRFRRRCCVFPAHTPTANRDALAGLLRGRARDLAASVLGSPGLMQKSLTGNLGMSRKTVRRYLDHLVSLGLIEEIQAGRRRTYFPSPRLETLLAPA